MYANHTRPALGHICDNVFRTTCMIEIVIPWEEILTNQPISSTVLKFVVECGSYCGIELTKPARVEVDSVRMEFFELQRLLAKDDMEIKIIQGDK